MKNIQFRFLERHNLEKMLPALFRVLHTNMCLIAPTNNSYEEDLEFWRMNIILSMQSENRQIALMYVGEEFAGYFQYSVKTTMNSLLIEEMEIKKEFQNSGLLSACWKWLVPQLPKGLKTVEAYANKNNEKSQCILAHIGLTRFGENKNGKSYYYKGDFSFLYSKYKIG